MAKKKRRKGPSFKLPSKFPSPQIDLSPFRIFLLCALLFVVYFVFFPRVSTLATQNPSTSAFIEDYQKAARAKGENDQVKQEWKALAQISPNLKNAVLISEDDGFFAHDGVAPEEIKLAIQNWINGKKLRGASTITQQLAKNLYLSPSRNPLRKLREILIAKRLESSLSKNRIFELYLNIIEWGKGVYGAEAASQYYFKKPALRLSEREAVYLAAIIPNPVFLTQKSKSRYVKSREDILLARLRRYPPRF